MGEGRIKELMRYFHLSENEFADALEAELRSPDFKPTGLYTRCDMRHLQSFIGVAQIWNRHYVSK